MGWLNSVTVFKEQGEDINSSTVGQFCDSKPSMPTMNTLSYNRNAKNSLEKLISSLGCVRSVDGSRLLGREIPILPTAFSGFQVNSLQMYRQQFSGIGFSADFAQMPPPALQRFGAIVLQQLCIDSIQL